MPIYAYRCAACGHSRDVLQKMSDAPLTVCPVCGAGQFQKQVTAAGFQLKGSGWYVTDFRNGGGAAAPSPAPAPAEGGSAAPAPAPAPASGGSTGGATSAAASAGACGGGCACH
jgi:putative FmdB family regulatory protein